MDIKYQYRTLEISKTVLMVSVLLLSCIITQTGLYSAVCGVNTSAVTVDKNSNTRSINELIMDSITLSGVYSDGKALFTLSYLFYTAYNNQSVRIPLIGPADKAMAINLSVDNSEERIEFTNEYYFFSGNLSEGDHELVFKLSSNIFIDEIISLDYTIYGPALNYYLNFKIPTPSGKEIFIIDPMGAMVVETNEAMLLTWEHFAVDKVAWNFIWTEYSPPTKNDLDCEIDSEVLITDTKAIIDVRYRLEFPGFGLERITFDSIEKTSLKSTNKGAIITSVGELQVEFDELIKDRIILELRFETLFVKELIIQIPEPLNCRITGEVALFSDLDLRIELFESANATLIGYSGDMKPGTSFIGNYYFTENSKLGLKISPRETSITAWIIDTLKPTFDGFEFETWILLNFYGSSPNSLTIELAPGGKNDKLQGPQLLVEPNNPIPILDHNWDRNLNRLTLWFGSNLSQEYLLGLRWDYQGYNVTMEQLTIVGAQTMEYFVGYYLEKNVEYSHIYETGLHRSSYDLIPLKLRDRLKTGFNIEIYETDNEYISILQISKSTDLKSEIFLRNWISDIGIDMHQIVRITSDRSVANMFAFSIPSNITSLNVKGCAAWTIIDGDLVVYTFKGTGNFVSFYIETKIANGSTQLSPFMPMDIEENKIYTMFGSASNLNITINYYNAEPMNPDELPYYFLTEINTPKAVKIYYSTRAPRFEVKTEKYSIEETPTTVIENAQITIITSIDGKMAVHILYMVKNVDRLEMHVTLPAAGVVWMVLVGGKTVPIIEHNNMLTVILIRSTLSGENIAFPVEIVYMITEPMEELEFIMPQVDVSILNLKVNIGIPSSMHIKDPGKYNPNFEVEGWDKWKSGDKYSGTGTGPDGYLDYGKDFSNQLSKVSYDRDVKEPDSIYIGIYDQGEDSSSIEIEKIDVDSDDSEPIKYSLEIDSTNSYLNPNSNIRFTKFSLLQGQYTLNNAGVQRQITVTGGKTQQIIFDSNDEMVFTDVPPIYLQFPKSGQVLRLGAIFFKPNENSSITLQVDDPKSKCLDDKFILDLGTEDFLQFIFLVIIVTLICIFLFRKIRKPTRHNGQKVRKKHIKRSNKLKEKDMQKSSVLK